MEQINELPGVTVNMRAGVHESNLRAEARQLLDELGMGLFS
jgi:hypothetical protein